MPVKPRETEQNGPDVIVLDDLDTEPDARLEALKNNFEQWLEYYFPHFGDPVKLDETTTLYRHPLNARL